MFMMMQFIYYGALQRRREQVLKIQARRRHHHRRHHHQQHHHTGSSRERDALSGQPAHSSTGPAANGGLDQQQQGQGQSSAWPPQQDHRRVPHQTVGVNGGQQMQLVSAAAFPSFAVASCCAFGTTARMLLGAAVHAYSLLYLRVDAAKAMTTSQQNARLQVA
jgi:hypothetical protein